MFQTMLVLSMAMAAPTDTMWPKNVEHRFVVQVRTDYGWVSSIYDGDGKEAAIAGLALAADLRCTHYDKAGPKAIEVRCDIADASVWATQIKGEKAVQALLQNMERALEDGHIAMNIHQSGRIRWVRAENTGFRGRWADELEEKLSWTMSNAMSPLDLLAPTGEAAMGDTWQVQGPLAYRMPVAWPVSGNNAFTMTVAEPGPSPTMAWSSQHNVRLDVSSVHVYRYSLACEGKARWDAKAGMWERSAVRIHDVSQTDPNVVGYHTMASVRRIPATSKVTLDPTAILPGLPSDMGPNSYRVAHLVE